MSGRQSSIVEVQPWKSPCPQLPHILPLGVGPLIKTFNIWAGSFESRPPYVSHSGLPNVSGSTQTQPETCILLLLPCSFHSELVDNPCTTPKGDTRLQLGFNFIKHEKNCSRAPKTSKRIPLKQKGPRTVCRTYQTIHIIRLMLWKVTFDQLQPWQSRGLVKDWPLCQTPPSR